MIQITGGGSNPADGRPATGGPPPTPPPPPGAVYPPCHPHCADPGGTHCNFEYVTQRKTWQDADRDCAARQPGGHLASITSDAEQAQLEALIPDGKENTVWIGLNDVLSEALCDGDSFSWSGGSTATFRDWASSQPDNRPDGENPCDPTAGAAGCDECRAKSADHNEDCVEAWQGYAPAAYTIPGRTWADASCDIVHQCKSPSQSACRLWCMGLF